MRERREAAEAMQKQAIHDLSNLAARSQALILESHFFGKTKSDNIVNQLLCSGRLSRISPRSPRHKFSKGSALKCRSRFTMYS